MLPNSGSLKKNININQNHVPQCNILYAFLSFPFGLNESYKYARQRGMRGNQVKDKTETKLALNMELGHSYVYFENIWILYNKQ